MNNKKNINININRFLDKFNEEYKFIYEHPNVEGWDEALIEGDEFISEHKDFVSEFVKFRGDYLSSDREVVAFMFALSDLIDD